MHIDFLVGWVPIPSVARRSWESIKFLCHQFYGHAPYSCCLRDLQIAVYVESTISEAWWSDALSSHNFVTVSPIVESIPAWCVFFHFNRQSQLHNNLTSLASGCRSALFAQCKRWRIPSPMRPTSKTCRLAQLMLLLILKPCRGLPEPLRSFTSDAISRCKAITEYLLVPTSSCLYVANSN